MTFGKMNVMKWNRRCLEIDLQLSCKSRWWWLELLKNEETMGPRPSLASSSSFRLPLSTPEKGQPASAVADKSNTPAREWIAAENFMISLFSIYAMSEL
jgi:hypothetical protein